VKLLKKYQNKQLWCECWLVSLWNAYRFFGKIPPTMGTPEYRKICEDACCISGACFNSGIERERKRLGIKFVPGQYKLSWIKNNLPVELSLFTKHRGYHSVLVVKTWKNKIQLANYTYGKLQWLPWSRVLELCNKRECPCSYQLSNR
jgi:hypothetical protein